jgi:hypothetical protein
MIHDATVQTENELKICPPTSVHYPSRQLFFGNRDWLLPKDWQLVAIKVGPAKLGLMLIKFRHSRYASTRNQCQHYIFCSA